MSWRREWIFTPVFLPGEFHGQRSLLGYSPWGCRVRCNWMTNLTNWAAYILSHVLLLLTLWTVACQASLSIGFPRQEYPSGSPFPSLEDLRPRDWTHVSWVSWIGRQFYLSMSHLGTLKIGSRRIWGRGLVSLSAEKNPLSSFLGAYPWLPVVRDLSRIYGATVLSVWSFSVQTLPCHKLECSFTIRVHMIQSFCL